MKLSNVKDKVSRNATSFVNGGRSTTVTVGAGALALLNLLEGNIGPALATATISTAHIQNIIHCAKKIVKDEQTHPNDGAVGYDVNVGVVSGSAVNSFYNFANGDIAGGIGSAVIGLSFLLNNIYLDLKARGLDKNLSQPGVIASIWTAVALGASSVTMSNALDGNLLATFAKGAIAVAHGLGAIFMCNKHFSQNLSRSTIKPVRKQEIASVAEVIKDIYKEQKQFIGEHKDSRLWLELVGAEILYHSYRREDLPYQYELRACYVMNDGRNPFAKGSNHPSSGQQFASNLEDFFGSDLSENQLSLLRTMDGLVKSECKGGKEAKLAIRANVGKDSILTPDLETRLLFLQGDQRKVLKSATHFRSSNLSVNSKLEDIPANLLQQLICESFLCMREETMTHKQLSEGNHLL